MTVALAKCQANYLHMADTLPYAASQIGQLAGTGDQKPQINYFFRVARALLGYDGGGLKLPALTQTERDAIASPQAGAMIVNSTTGRINYYDSVLAAWMEQGFARPGLYLATGAYTVPRTTETVGADATGGAFTVSLPTPVGYPGEVHTVKNQSTNTNLATVNTPSGGTIEGAASLSLRGAPFNEMATFVSDNTKWIVTSRARMATPYELAGFYRGKPLASDVLMRFDVVRAFTLLHFLPDSLATALVAATASTSFLLNQNGVSFGSFTFAAGATVATFTSLADWSFAIGDYITVTAPATPDATLSNVSFNLAGYYR